MLTDQLLVDRADAAAVKCQYLSQGVIKQLYVTVSLSISREKKSLNLFILQLGDMFLI